MQTLLKMQIFSVKADDLKYVCILLQTLALECNEIIYEKLWIEYNTGLVKSPERIEYLSYF